MCIEMSEVENILGNTEQKVVELESVTIRFAGDSGDGMQLTGTQFTNTAAMIGNDIETLPDFPAEIRAPAGSLPGVSAFQLHFSSKDIRTPGDQPDVLVAMNAAALKVHLPDLQEGGLLIANTNGFDKSSLKKAGYTANPLEEDNLGIYRVVQIPITDLTLNAVQDTGLSQKQAVRSKNFFALGILYYVYDRPLEHTVQWVEKKFGADTEIGRANVASLKAGYNYADTVELFTTHYRVKKATFTPGKYRKITGNEATALGFVTAAQRAGRHLFYGSYPITPASDILHELARLRHFGVKTFQAEDEIAAVCSSIGASFAGDIALTGSSGPGIALKAEAIGLAVMTELPLIIVNVQRGGPSTGLPTKTEQSDLLQVLYGRNGECPVVVLAPSTPGDCFYMAIEAVRLAVKYMTPVFLLSDGYLANGAEPWKIPKLSDLPEIKVEFHTDPSTFQPYNRNPETLARPWAIPGTPGLEHRIGGLEKEDGSGNVSYDPENHHRMTEIRAKKIANIAEDIPEGEVFGEPQGDLLVLGWGGTYGAITSAVEDLQKRGVSVSSLHLKYLNPFPKNLEKILRSFKKILVPELNMGQLEKLIRDRFLIDTFHFHKVYGKPFKVSELTARIEEVLGDKS